MTQSSTPWPSSAQIPPGCNEKEHFQKDGDTAAGKYTASAPKTQAAYAELRAVIHFATTTGHPEPTGAHARVGWQVG